MTDKPITPETVRAALLPCPFCGGLPEWKSGGPGCAYISCTSCPAETNDGSIPRIAEAWNTRATAYLAQAEENERLRKRVEAADALVKRAEEELRLIRMKDTGAVYDILLRTDIAAYRATKGQSHE